VKLGQMQVQYNRNYNKNNSVNHNNHDDNYTFQQLLGVMHTSLVLPGWLHHRDM